MNDDIFNLTQYIYKLFVLVNRTRFDTKEAGKLIKKIDAEWDRIKTLISNF